MLEEYVTKLFDILTELKLEHERQALQYIGVNDTRAAESKHRSDAYFNAAIEARKLHIRMRENA